MSEKIPPIEVIPPISVEEQTGKTTKEVGAQQTQEHVEEEFSPEVIEKVMAKVKDVLEKGEAVHVIRSNVTYRWAKGKPPLGIPEDELLAKELASLALVLELGLLGNEKVGKLPKQERDVLVNEWMSKTRKEPKSVVYASIVGRNMGTHSLQSFFNDDGAFGVLINLDSFKEHLPIRALESDHDLFLSDVRKAKTHTFRAKEVPFSSSRFLEKLFEKSGIDNLKWLGILRNLGLLGESVEIAAFLEKLKSKREALIDHGIPEESVDDMIKCAESGSYEEMGDNPESDEGFIITHRVAPRHFDGFYLTMGMHGKHDEHKDYFKESDPLAAKRLKGIVEIMGRVSTQTGKNRYLPIYDLYGNLLWPKQMTHEEVKKLVAERKQNKEKEQ